MTFKEYWKSNKDELSLVVNKQTAHIIWDTSRRLNNPTVKCDMCDSNAKIHFCEKCLNENHV